ncbi:MAG: rRNA maturation RNase YbeY [Dehalococcoidales bacterium]|nr:rRNA maturation RNase YbeY [Dehalococcoidales bacterium]
MKRMEIDIIFDEGFEDCLGAGWLQGVAEAALSAENTGDNVEMSLVITSQEKVRRLNRDFRGKDKSTDVISFAMLDELPVVQSEDKFTFVVPPDGVKHLGEVIISYPQAVMQADEHGHPVKKEMAILTIHGVLHLLGYDHIKDEEAEEMEDRERVILKSIMGEL